MEEIFEISKSEYEQTKYEQKWMKKEYDNLKKAYDELVSLIGIVSKIAKEVPLKWVQI